MDLQDIFDIFHVTECHFILVDALHPIQDVSGMLLKYVKDQIKISGFFWGTQNTHLNQSRPIFKLRLIEIDTNDLIVGRIFVGPEAKNGSLIGDVIIISFKFRYDFGPLQFPINLGMFAEVSEIEQRILAALHDRE